MGHKLWSQTETQRVTWPSTTQNVAIGQKLWDEESSNIQTGLNFPVLWAPQKNFHLPPLYWGGSKNLRDRCLNIWANQNKTMCTPLKKSEKIWDFLEPNLLSPTFCEDSLYRHAKEAFKHIEYYK